MLKAASQYIPNSRIWTEEIDRSKDSKPSYWIDTLRRARRELSRSTPLRFIIGSDQALVFQKWKDFRKILKLAEPLVMVRPPHANRAAVLRAMRALRVWTPEELKQWGTWINSGKRLGLSSTEARSLLAQGRGRVYLRKSLPPEVRRYIAKHNLYS